LRAQIDGGEPATEDSNRRKENEKDDPDLAVPGRQLREDVFNHAHCTKAQLVESVFSLD
jgi:hypothetical protein